MRLPIFYVVEPHVQPEVVPLVVEPDLLPVARPLVVPEVDDGALLSLPSWHRESVKEPPNGAAASNRSQKRFTINSGKRKVENERLRLA